MLSYVCMHFNNCKAGNEPGDEISSSDAVYIKSYTGHIELLNMMTNSYLRMVYSHLRETWPSRSNIVGYSYAIC